MHSQEAAAMADFDPAHVERGGLPHRYPGGPLEVAKLHVGPYENNAYLLRDPETNDALLVDAANETERLLGLISGAQLVGIVTTHRHPDHIQALAGVLRRYQVWNGAHPADADAIADQVGVTPDRVLEHGDTLQVGRYAVTVLHTPGHTEGSISFKLPAGQVLTGDALFPGGVGKTDGPEAFGQAIRSAEQHLLSLPGETRISPGHGDDTLVEREAPALDEWKARGW
jgi:glyoxylase-like metal-dependent hydrolase (beta-lactamase superfamily II)